MVTQSTETGLINPSKGKKLRVVQITDLHLFSMPSSSLQGYCTYEAFRGTVDYLITNLSLKPDLILLTGDLSQDESVESYQLALLQLKRLNSPIYWIHGNHDSEDKVRFVFDSAENVKQLSRLCTPTWDFISLNTCRPGTDNGHIEEVEYESFLEKIEKSKKDKKAVAVVMHHHPFPVATPLIDACMLQDNERLITILNTIPEIKLVICGHVHGEYTVKLSRQNVETGIATCFQWEKGTHTIRTENKRGFTIFDFDEYSYLKTTVYI
jgi:Icc protein